MRPYSSPLLTGPKLDLAAGILGGLGAEEAAGGLGADDVAREGAAVGREADAAGRAGAVDRVSAVAESGLGFGLGFGLGLGTANFC